MYFKNLVKEVAAKSDSWFANLSQKQKNAYIKKHPESKYAKQYRAKTKLSVTGDSKTVQRRLGSDAKGKKIIDQLAVTDKRIVDKLFKKKDSDTLEKMLKDPELNKATKRYIEDALDDLEDSEDDDSFY